MAGSRVAAAARRPQVLALVVVVRGADGHHAVRVAAVGSPSSGRVGGPQLCAPPSMQCACLCLCTRLPNALGPSVVGARRRRSWACLVGAGWVGRGRVPLDAAWEMDFGRVCVRGMPWNACWAARQALLAWVGPDAGLGAGGGRERRLASCRQRQQQ